jgi:adenine-specific DNA-methyltransferase
MPAKKNSAATLKSVETLKHGEARRKNIPTAEHQSVIQKEQEAPRTLRYPRNTDLDPQLVWRGKDEQDWSDLVVHAPPLYIQEKVHPKVLIDDLLRQSKEARAQEPGAQVDLFSDFNGMAKGVDKTEFYQHDQNWSNRMILGDSLQVMASLAEREGLRGKVQCIYFDPPYGIKFNSNFQWSTTSRDVKDGNAGHITREPEQVKAFRDTWRDGIHSYLTYLRDRLTVARDLLTESGSIFVQIGDENVHRVRAVLEEVFGDENLVAQIATKTSGGSTGVYLSGVVDHVLWFAKNTEHTKYRPLFGTKSFGGDGADKYTRVRLSNLETRSLTPAERALETDLPAGTRVYRQDNITSQSVGRDKGEGAASWFPVKIVGQEIRPSIKVRWKTNELGMQRLLYASRVELTGNSLSYVRYLDDFSAATINNSWTDIGGIQSRADPKVYVVQTPTTLIQRCMLMATDPGDLVLDPTCGSGTTAYVAEQWGRRWITIDTSRVALALARARIMGARYPFYVLADSRDGQVKEAEVTRTAPSSQPVQGNIRHGFVYERVPHITLKSIANNAEIDVIWDEWQQTLEPLREQLNKALGKNWQEWEIPRELPSIPSVPSVLSLHQAWWTARIARQHEIDKSIAAKAEFEYLYDKPYEDKKKVRVAGPFTVESLSPHRVLGVDENDELIDALNDGSGEYGAKQSFPQMILENLKTAGVQQAHKEDRITFTALTPWPGELVCAEGRYLEGAPPSPPGRGQGEGGAGAAAVSSPSPPLEERAGERRPSARATYDSKPVPLPRGQGEGAVERRAAILIGPEFGTVQRADLVAAAREAGDAGFDVLIACAFNYEAHATEFSKLGRIPVLKARMNADLHMAEDLKTTNKANLFVIFGEPDITLLPEPDGTLRVKVNGVDVFDPSTGEVRSDSADGIACWFIDTDYNEESFFVRHAYFLGANDPYNALKTTLKAEINAEAWQTLNSDTSRPFEKPKSGRIAVKVINHLGDEVMKVFKTT